jgi:hypothetical protein
MPRSRRSTGRPRLQAGSLQPSDLHRRQEARDRGSARHGTRLNSQVERSNLSIRMQNRRFTRLTNAFSKTFQNHVHALALYFAFYSFVRVHKTLRMTPAMAAGVTDTLWTIEDIAERIEARATKPGKRGAYKNRGASLAPPIAIGGRPAFLRGVRHSGSNMLERRCYGPEKLVHSIFGLIGHERDINCDTLRSAR